MPMTILTPVYGLEAAQDLFNPVRHVLRDFQLEQPERLTAT